MNPRTARIVINALRSGRYKQAHFTLEERVDGETRNCCLGVITREAMADGVPIAASRRPRATHVTFEDEAGKHTAALPEAAQAWLGVDNRAPYFDGISSIDRNDGRCDTFDVIADAIEADLTASVGLRLTDDEARALLNLSERGAYRLPAWDEERAQGKLRDYITSREGREDDPNDDVGA